MSEPIRILLTISDLSGGGAEREFATLVRHLSRERFAPELCFHRSIFAYDCPDDLPVHIVERSRPWHTPRAIAAIRRVIDQVRPQVVFSQLHYVNMLTGSALARSQHRPRWVCRQVNDPRRDMRGPFASWARRALARADRVLGCCEGVSQAMIEHLRLDPGRVQTLVNAVDVGRVEQLAGEPLPIERRPAEFVVAHAGRLSAQKNQAMLLEAFARFRGEPAELWILGEGDMKERLVRRARTLGIAGQVRWLGFRSNPYPFLRSADCFALSSDHEGLPNALIEAMICGTPAVATRCPFGPDELIDPGVSGLLTPVGDSAAFAEALMRLARDREAARRMGREARERSAARFDTSRVCASYARLFEEMAAAPR
jgi:glycosyltransferase involved in cell wall biosynthesis